MLNVGALSFAAALCAYLLLTLLLLTAWRDARRTGLLAVTAALASAIWAGILLLQRMDGSHDWRIACILAELLRGGAWFWFLTHILGLDRPTENNRLWSGVVLATLVGTSLMMFTPSLLERMVNRPDWLDKLAIDLPFLGAIALAILGLFLIEQIYLGRRPAQRRAIKHLCLGLGGVFVYDLYVFSDALLVKRLEPLLWDARGIVNALIVPLIAVSIARNPKWELGVHVSRDVVFHSATLTGAGVYLIAMAGAGYYIRFIGGSWGGILQIAFLFIAGLLLIVLLFSGSLRARLRLLIGEHFFSFRYNYRDEWLRFTDKLAHGGDDVPTAVVVALGKLVDSEHGAIWLRRDTGGFELATAVRMPGLSETPIPDAHLLPRFLTKTGWVVDIDEYHARPDLYGELELPLELARHPRVWLIVPLLFQRNVCGFVVLSRPSYRRRVDWEDRSLLKTAGQQAASHVAQYLANIALTRARQFEAFNQLSAYVAHDLKNLLAQQSLILSNAEKHKHNPEFIEDVLATIRNSVQRMTRLMTQLREGIRGARPEPVALDALLREAVAMRANVQPIPRISQLTRGLSVEGDQERLRTVLCHLIQNAQEACAPTGRVEVRLFGENGMAVVEIEDNGVGMSEAFVRERLFRPFDSTKGLTGMGIGAFESREIVRAHRGELSVRSQPGQGSRFRIALPCFTPAPANTNEADS